jgi:hypothetical protein
MFVVSPLQDVFTKDNVSSPLSAGFAAAFSADPSSPSFPS